MPLNIPSAEKILYILITSTSSYRNRLMAVKRRDKKVNIVYNELEQQRRRRPMKTSLTNGVALLPTLSHLGGLHLL